MLSLSPAGLIGFAQSLPPEALLAFEILFAFSAVVALFRWFGAAGLMVWVVVGILGANVQVLKIVAFGLFPAPVALGTVLFASTYLATDLLAEHYGPAAARRAVWLGFAAYAAFTLVMLLTLGYAPLDPARAAQSNTEWALPIQGHLEALFIPAPALFVAGMAAYLTSQLLDVRVFAALRQATQGRFLWLRNNASTMVSALVDNTVFSFLAWVILAANPLPLESVIGTYILGTYVFRVALALLDTPFAYLARLAARGAPDSPHIPVLSPRHAHG